MLKNIRQLITTTLPYEIYKFKKAGEGCDCVAYNINDEYIIKIPKNSVAREKLKHEAKILESLANKNLNLQVPKLLTEINTNNDKLPYYTVITKMHGVQLTRRKFDSLNNDEKLNAAKDIALFLYNLHHFSLVELELTPINIKDKYISDRENLFKLFDFNSETKNNINEFYNKIINFYTEHPPHYGLIHGDFSVDMIFYDYNNHCISGIIDFGNGTISDTESDFIYLLEGKEDYPIDFGEKVLNFYSPYCNRSLIDDKIKLDHIYWDFETIFLAQKFNNKKLINKGLQKILKNKKLKAIKYFKL